MDTSNSDLEYVLSGKTVPGSDFSSEQWLKIVREIYKVMYPYRDYLTLLRSHDRAVDAVCSHTGTVSEEMLTRPHKITYNAFTPQPSLGANSRLLPLIPLYGWEPGTKPRWHVDDSFYRVDEILYDQYLLRSVVWVKLERRMQRVYYDHQPTSQVMVEYNFTELGEESLHSAIGERPRRWQMLCDALLRHLQRVVDQKRQHMCELQNALEKGWAIRSRVAVD